MNKFLEKMYNFFRERYGVDELYKFLFVLFIILWILNLIFSNPLIYLLLILTFMFMIYRVFSKKIYKRQAENNKYKEIKEKILGKIKIKEKKFKDKTHIYRKCPNCKAEIRLPKKRGTHTCTCPRCRKDFTVKCYTK